MTIPVTLVYNGVEKSLADWGIAMDISRTDDNKAKSTVTFRTAEDFDGATGPQFAFDGVCQIWLNRTYSGGAFSGGTLWFKGWFDDPRREIGGDHVGIRYAVHNVWWRFERNHFKQVRKIFTAYTSHTPPAGPMLTNSFASEVFLGENANELPQTNGQQIVEVCNWMNECYNPTKRGATSGRDDSQDIVVIGTIEPDVSMPVSRANSISCAEAIMSVLKWSPDARICFDYSDPDTPLATMHVLLQAHWNFGTTPPTFVDYANPSLTLVSINITADQERQIVAGQQSMRQVPGVIIYYHGTGSYDGQPWPFLAVDAYPPGTTDYTPEVSSHSVELPGAQVTHVQAQVVTGAFSVEALWTAAWWVAHDLALNDPSIDQSTIVVTGAAVTYPDGSAINWSEAPWTWGVKELLSPLPWWTGYSSAPVKCAATVAFWKYTDESHTHREQVVTGLHVIKTIRLTNCFTGTFRALQSLVMGAAIPQNVAESIYRSMNIPTWAGEIAFVNNPMRTDLSLKCRLQLVGPHTTFDNLSIQSITWEPCTGVTSVRFGPPAAPDADGLTQVALASRFRTVYNMPSGRSTGGALGDGFDASADAPISDTAHSLPGKSYSAETALAS